jgi:WD40 repeat protein
MWFGVTAVILASVTRLTLMRAVQVSVAVVAAIGLGVLIFSSADGRAGPEAAGGVTYAEFSPNGRLVAGLVDGDVRIWNASTGRVLHTFRSTDAHYHDVNFSPDGKRVVAAAAIYYEYSEAGKVAIWDAATGRLLYAFIDDEHEITSATFSPDGSLVLLTGLGIGLLDADGQVDKWGGDMVSVSAEFSPDGTRAVTIDKYLQMPPEYGANDEAPYIWNVRSGKGVHVLRGDSDAVTAVFSPDGKLVVTGKRIWDARTGRMLHVLRGQGLVWKVVFSPDAKRVLTVSSEEGGWIGGDETARIWDVRTGRSLKTLRATNAALSPDGRVLAITTKDGVVRTLDARTYRTLHTLRGSGPAFSPNGKLLLTIVHGSPQIWDASNGRALRTLPSL